MGDSDDIDIKKFLKFFYRNKRFIGFSSLLFFIIACIYSITTKRVWEGQFQIVLSSRDKIISDVNPIIQNFISKSSKPDINTQVGILNSPSVLMPIFNMLKKIKVKKK